MISPTFTPNKIKEPTDTMGLEPIHLTPISVAELRELMRPKGRVFLPDHVARAVRNRSNVVDPAELQEIGPIMTELVNTMHEWMEKEGIKIPTSLDTSLPQLDQRERSRLELLAILIPYHALNLYAIDNNTKRAEEAITEGVIWARVAESPRLEAFVVSTLAGIYFNTREFEKAFTTYAEALRLSELPGDDVWMELMVAGEYTSVLVSSNHLDQALPIIDEKLQRGEEYLSEDGHSTLFPLLLMNKARILSTRDRKGEAIAVLQRGLELAKLPHGFSGHLLPILQHLGIQYQGLGDKATSIIYYQEMIQVAEETKNTIARIWGYIRLGDAYLELKDFENAEKALHIALTYAPEGTSQYFDYIYADLAKLRWQQKRYDEALEFCQRVFDLFDKEGTPLQVIAHDIRARVLIEKEELSEAEAAFRKALEVHTQMDEHEPPFPMFLGLAQLLVEMGREGEATVILDDVIKDLKNTSSHHYQTHLATAYRIKANIAASHNDYSAAYQLACLEHKIATNNLETKAKITLQNVRVLSEVELLKAEAKLEREQRKHVEKSLAETLLAFEGNRHTLESVEEQLQKTLSLIEREKAREVVSLLRHVLDKIELPPNPVQHSLHYLQAIDQEFFVRLRARWPSLTRKQEQYCGLIRVGLSSKEIATILNLTQEGVRAQRKRLRKRLGLETKQRLESVIMEV